MPHPEIELIARGLAVRAGHILLCRNRAKGYFYLPGGHIEPGEPARAALEREFAEETGHHVRATELVLVAENIFLEKGKSRHEVNLVFRVELDGWGDAPTPVESREDSIAFAWLHRAQLASADMRPGAIRDWVLRHDQPTPCSFLATTQVGPKSEP